MKTKKEYPVVTAEWIDVTDPEYDLELKCPNKRCGYHFQYHDMLMKDVLNVYQGTRVNRLVSCPSCERKFKLKVKAL